MCVISKFLKLFSAKIENGIIVDRASDVLETYLGFEFDPDAQCGLPPKAKIFVSALKESLESRSAPKTEIFRLNSDSGQTSNTYLVSTNIPKSVSETELTTPPKKSENFESLIPKKTPKSSESTPKISKLKSSPPIPIKNQTMEKISTRLSAVQQSPEIIPKKLSLKHFSVLNQSIISYNNWNLNLLEELEDSNLENMDQPIQSENS